MLLVLSGCTLKGNGGDENNVLPGNGNGNGGTVVTPPAPGPQPLEPEVVKSPILCNDEIIVNNISAYLGPGYVVTKSPAAIGQTFQNADCLIKWNNMAQLTYYISEQPSEATALNVLEDEKNQYAQQLFRNSYQEYTLGTRSYFFEQPVLGGSLYRLIFVDGTNTKVNVFIKSNVALDRSVVEALGIALEKSI